VEEMTYNSRFHSGRARESTLCPKWLYDGEGMRDQNWSVGRFARMELII